MIKILILAVSSLSVSLASREESRFNLGWRFAYDVPASECVANFPTNMSNIECQGLSNAPASSPEECEQACCLSSTCQVWQYREPADCWIGLANACGGQSNWISFANFNRTASTDVPNWAWKNFTDSNWTLVDAPHDFIIGGANESISYFNQSNPQGQAFLPGLFGYYRKHFKLPTAWQNSHIEFYFEEFLSSATFYLNDQYLGAHVNGYTSSFFRIDNVTGLVFGGGDNVLSVFVDATSGAKTGWWYEGSGQSRDSYIYATSRTAHVVPDGTYAIIAVEEPFTYPADPKNGITAPSASFNVQTEVETDLAGGAVVNVVTYIYAQDGVTLVGQGTASNVTVLSNATVIVSTLITISNVEIWSSPRPYLYTIVTNIFETSAPTVLLDNKNTTAGVRTTRFDANEGFYLNDQQVKFRGFCDHESFAVVGSAVPDRVNLYRYQSMRGMGGNARRFSHNPPAPALLKLADRLGVMTLDENRIFSVGYDYNMRDLARRDRSHPSVVFYSFCNEPGCNNPDRSAPLEPSQAFKDAVELSDSTRSVTGNMCVGWGNCPTLQQYLDGLEMSFVLDVQGFSHVDDSVFRSYHEKWPLKPLVASECCSCETQRGEDSDLPYNKTSVFYPNENSACVSQQTQWSNGLSYVAGSFVWTAFDYYGEPDAWPHISSSFGSWDLAGFLKAPVYWYRSWWLANISATSPDRIPSDPSVSSFFAHIVEAWQPSPLVAYRIIHVYSNAPFVALSLNGVPTTSVAVPAYGIAKFNITYAPGTLTAIGYAADGVTQVVSSSKSSFGAPASIVLSLDAPSLATGTGSSLFLDGFDAALVRATIVDSNGNVCSDANDILTFSVVEGPAIVLGVANGNPSSHSNPHNTSIDAYHGLVRGVIRVSQSSASLLGDASLRLEQFINYEAGLGPKSSSIVFLPPSSTPPSITVRVTSPSNPSLAPATITIATSIDPSAHAFNVAGASVTTPNLAD
jgi:Glycoside hydrolase family 2 C-terminal domain 5/Glycosyl hydrolases family 2, TIM barrel domain/Glycosyl hydrolases family 2, sugar binding domain/Domain of unknown function (DUF4982)/Glycosyl hydrolases family 2